MRYLFIFKPHPQWHYCGGLACIAAHSFAEAVQYCKAEDKRRNDNLFREMQEVERDDGDTYIWVLECRIPITDETPVGIVALNWNYA
jgi:hypothetical protein